MTLFEIIVIIVCTSIVLAVFLNWLIRKIKGLPTGDCAMCSSGSKKLYKQYKKFIKNNY